MVKTCTQPIQITDQAAAPKPDSYVTFTVVDQLARVAQWVELSFLCPHKVHSNNIRCVQNVGFSPPVTRFIWRHEKETYMRTAGTLHYRQDLQHLAWRVGNQGLVFVSLPSSRSWNRIPHAVILTDTE